MELRYVTDCCDILRILENAKIENLLKILKTQNTEANSKSTLMKAQNKKAKTLWLMMMFLVVMI